MRPTIGTLGLLCACVGQLGQLGAQQAAEGIAKRRVTPEVWHPRLEQFTPAGTLQTEFGSPLNDAGYRKLRSTVTWTAATERTDYYFDAYDGNQFLLRTGGMPIKVRIKRKSESPVWQVSRFVAKDRVAVGALGIYVHTTESWDGVLGGLDVAALLDASDRFASRLTEGGPALRAAADAVEAAWRSLRTQRSLPGLMVIDHTLVGHDYRFYPRKVTPAKTRLRALLPGVTGTTVTLMLGTEPEVDANGKPVVSYGLEAEADKPSSPAQARSIALAIGRFMQRAGITDHDQQEVVSASNEYTLRQLGR